MKEKRKVSLLEQYLTKEIGIEFKACLYFFAILFLYCIFRLVEGSHDASILHLAEMIISCYLICYIQVYCFGNFDGADSIKAREIIGILVCSVIYCVISYFCGWFYKKISYTLIFAAYLLLIYVCIFLVYRVKREIDDKILNEELKSFQEEHKKSE